MEINDINLKIISDSRGRETLEAVIYAERSKASRIMRQPFEKSDKETNIDLHRSFEVKASVPSGKSTGSHEAFVLEPHKALEKFKTVKNEIIAASERVKTQKEFDKFLIALDGTSNKNHLGGNLILALSLAYARYKAKSQGIELFQYIYSIQHHDSFNFQLSTFNLPRPIFNVINGGLHSGFPRLSASPAQCDSAVLSFQEFQIIPQVDDFAVGLSIGKEFYRKLGILLEKKFGKENISLGDEAGYSAPFKSNEEAIETLSDLIKKYHYPLRIGLDCASSSFFRSAEPRGTDAEERGKESGFYLVDGREYSAEQLLKYYLRLSEKYNILSIEDPFFEEDFHSFSQITEKISDLRRSNSDRRRSESDKREILVIADDLTTTNHDRLQKAIKEKSGNSILIKLNQIGTLTETLDVVNLAYKNNWKAVVSHRSGETMDDFIADLAFAVGAWGIKAGAPAKPERMAKYNRLLEISRKS